MILTLGLLLGTLGPSTPNTRQVPLFNGIDRTVELSAPVGAGDVLYFKIRSDGSMTDACVIDAGSLRVSVQNNVLVGQGCTVEVLGQGDLSIPVDIEFRSVKVTSNVNDRVRYLGSLGGSSRFFNGSLIDIDSEGLSFPMSFGNLDGSIIPNVKDDGRAKYSFTGGDDHLRVPQITLEVGDQLELKFIAPRDIAWNFLFDSSELSTRGTFYQNGNDGTVQFNSVLTTVILDGNPVTHNSSQFPRDGLEHTLVLTALNTVTMDYFGIASDNTGRVDFPIYDIKVIRNSQVVLEYNVDEGSGDRVISTGPEATEERYRYWFDGVNDYMEFPQYDFVDSEIRFKIIPSSNMSDGVTYGIIDGVNVTPVEDFVIYYRDGSVQAQCPTVSGGSVYVSRAVLMDTENELSVSRLGGTITITNHTTGETNSITADFKQYIINQVGRWNTGSTSHFEGAIYDIEIKKLGLEGTEPERSYPVDSGSGTDVPDTVSGTNGTLVNSQESSWKLSKATDGTLVSYKPLAWTRAEGGNGIGKNFNVTAWETIEL